VLAGILRLLATSLALLGSVKICRMGKLVKSRSSSSCLALRVIGFFMALLCATGFSNARAWFENKKFSETLLKPKKATHYKKHIGKSSRYENQIR
jgi:hypothetical protein